MQHLKNNTSQTFSRAFRRLAKSGVWAAALMICGLALAPASAQKPTRPLPRRQFCLRDDKTGQYLTFSNFGNYAFTDCPGGAVIEGMGRTEIAGCKISFVADTGSRLIQAEIDQCLAAGKASVLIHDDCTDDINCKGKQFLISDSNLKDSDCAACQ